MASLSHFEIEPFRVVRPVGREGPFVFASPHSGAHRPDDLGASDSLSQASLRSGDDALVDQLIASGPDHGAVLIAGAISRVYVDLNRSADELDQELIEDCPAGRVSPKTAAGFGVVPRRTGNGRPLYDRRLSLQEVQARVDRVHRPYHMALAELMHAAHQWHGGAVLVDWHSMPAKAAGAVSAPPSSGRPPSRGFDVILGDRHGASCGGRLTRTIRGLFEAAGWSVGLNQPYAGGHSTQLWGRPDDGFQAIQIELNRALYLDEATGQPGTRFDRCQAVIAGVIASLCAPPKAAL